MKTAPTFSKTQLTQFQFRYVVNNFSKLGREKISSEILSAPNSQIKWHLKIYSHGKDDHSKNCVSIYLHHESVVDKKKKVAFKLGILSAKNDLTNVRFAIFSGTNRGWNRFLEREILLDSKNSLLCGDQLTLQCTVYYCEEEINDQHNDALLKLLPSKYTTSRLHKRGINTDVILRVDDVKICVHKSILSSASCVFEAMFKADMKESHTQEVVIEDVSLSTMELLVSFLYDNETELPNESNDTVLSLLQAADKYQIIDLRLACQRKLAKLIDAENLIETLAVAEFYNAIELKNYALHCVVTNFSFLTNSNEKWYEDLDKKLLFDITKLMNEMKAIKE